MNIMFNHIENANLHDIFDNGKFLGDIYKSEGVYIYDPFGEVILEASQLIAIANKIKELNNELKGD